MAPTSAKNSKAPSSDKVKSQMTDCRGQSLQLEKVLTSAITPRTSDLIYNRQVLTERIQFRPEADAELFSAVAAAPAIFSSARRRPQLRALRQQDRQPAPPSPTPAFRSRGAYPPPQPAPSRPLHRVHADRLRFRIRIPPLSSPARRLSQNYANRLRLRFAPQSSCTSKTNSPAPPSPPASDESQARTSTTVPFASRLAAEKFMNDALDFFKMRRCVKISIPIPNSPAASIPRSKVSGPMFSRLHR